MQNTCIYKAPALKILYNKLTTATTVNVTGKNKDNIKVYWNSSLSHNKIPPKWVGFYQKGRPFIVADIFSIAEEKEAFR